MERIHEMPGLVSAPALLLLMAAGFDLGFRFSRRREHSPGLSSIQGATLGLIGLLFAFALSAAETRFMARRTMAVTEANAIGTMYLRAGLMASPTREQMRTRLRRYVDVRLASFEAAPDEEKLEALLSESARLHSELWALLSDAVPRLSFPVVTVTATALNQVIDVAAERKQAGLARVPSPLFFALLCAMLAGSFLVGYQPQAETRMWTLWGVFALLLTLVLITLIDLDLPREGFIRTSQQPLLDLRATLESWPLTGPP